MLQQCLVFIGLRTILTRSCFSVHALPSASACPMLLLEDKEGLRGISPGSSATCRAGKRLTEKQIRPLHTAGALFSWARKVPMVLTWPSGYQHPLEPNRPGTNTHVFHTHHRDASLCWPSPCPQRERDHFYFGQCVFADTPSQRICSPRNEPHWAR